MKKEEIPKKFHAGNCRNNNQRPFLHPVKKQKELPIAAKIPCRRKAL